MSSTNDRNNSNDDSDNDTNQPAQQIPYRRDRTPSIVVQSLGLSFQKDSNITGSIELAGDDEEDEDQDESSPITSEASDHKSSTSGIDDLNNAPVCDSSGGSGKGSSSSLQNSSTSPGVVSPIRGVLNSQPNIAKPRPNFGPAAAAAGNNNRRLSLNIGSTAPRRQSLTVDGLTSASFINPALKDSPGNATGSLRNKVALKPGHSLMGWIKLASTAKNLSGTNGKIIEVTPEELAKHNKEEDFWVALKGNVYNVTTYLHYHPGGIEELMRGAGRDATELFNEVHRWVNYESILAKTLVGPYKLDSPSTPQGRATFQTITGSPTAKQPNQPQQAPPIRAPTSSSSSSIRKDPTVAQKPPRRQSIALTVPSANKYQSLLLNNSSNTNLNQIQQPPTYVIMQDKTSIKLKIQDLTTLPLIRSRHVICDLMDRLELQISVILSPDWLYRVHLRLDQQIDENHLLADLLSDERQIIIHLNKKEAAIWNKIGTSLDLNDSLCEMTLADKYFRPCKLLNKQQLTHDTYLFEFKLDKTLIYIPIGWHVLLRAYLPPQNKKKLQTTTTTTNSENNNDHHYYYDDQRIYKNYTPVLPTLMDHDGLTDETGFMKQLYFIIKIYQDGVLTSKLDQLKIGDNVDISDYQCVDFDIEALVRSPIKHWIILAAGTGITPFCRIIPYLLSMADDHHHDGEEEALVESVTLVFFNKTQKDMIWRDQFDKLASKYESKFKVAHVLSHEPEEGGSNWTGRRGKVNKDLMAGFVDSKSPDELQILVCGPRAFSQLSESIAKELNLHEKLYKFHG